MLCCRVGLANMKSSSEQPRQASIRFWQAAASVGFPAVSTPHRNTKVNID